jgi:hypothetical protein
MSNLSFTSQLQSRKQTRIQTPKSCLSAQCGAESSTFLLLVDFHCMHTGLMTIFEKSVLPPNKKSKSASLRCWNAGTPNLNAGGVHSNISFHLHSIQCQLGIT